MRVIPFGLSGPGLLHGGGNGALLTPGVSIQGLAASRRIYGIGCRGVMHLDADAAVGQGFPDAQDAAVSGLD